MGVRRMVMAVVIPVAVVVDVVMAVAWRDRNAIWLAGARAFAVTQGAALCEPLHVMVMTFLSPPDVLFKAEHLGAVLAERAVHGRIASKNLVHPFAERIHHERVVS